MASPALLRSGGSHDDEKPHMWRRMRYNITAMMLYLSRILVYVSFISLIALVVWYSRELYVNGKEAHLIAWFSAG